jgi:hypothetical protein
VGRDDLVVESEPHRAPAHGPHLLGSLFLQPDTNWNVQAQRLGSELLPVINLSGDDGHLALHFASVDQMARLADDLTTFLVRVEQAGSSDSPVHFGRESTPVCGTDPALITEGPHEISTRPADVTCPDCRDWMELNRIAREPRAARYSVHFDIETRSHYVHDDHRGVVVGAGFTNQNPAIAVAEELEKLATEDHQREAEASEPIGIDTTAEDAALAPEGTGEEVGS